MKRITISKGLVFLILIYIIFFSSCGLEDFSRTPSDNLWLSYFYSLNMADIKLYTKLLSDSYFKYHSILSTRNKLSITYNQKEEINAIDFIFRIADINIVELKEIEVGTNYYKILANFNVELYQVPKKGFGGYFTISSYFLIKYKEDSSFNKYITEIEEIPFSSKNKNIASFGYIKSLYSEKFKQVQISSNNNRYKYNIISPNNNKIISTYIHYLPYGDAEKMIYMDHKGEKIFNFGY